MNNIVTLQRSAAFALMLWGVCGLLLLAGCGPKDIGEGSSSDAARAGAHVSPEENLRYPVTGASNTQRMLYYMNRPDVMSRVQDTQLRQYKRYMGFGPDPEEPAYREVPKQRSPFRQ